MAKLPFEKSSGNVFADIGFTPAEAAELTAKSSMIIAIKDTIEQRKLTQQEAARLCGTDQPTLSKVFRGRMESVTIDRLASWLNALGRDVEIIVKSSPRRRHRGRLRVIEASVPTIRNPTALRSSLRAIQECAVTTGLVRLRTGQLLNTPHLAPR